MSRLSDRTVLAPRWVGLLPYFRSVHTGRVQTPTRPWSYSVVRSVDATGVEPVSILPSDFNIRLDTIAGGSPAVTASTSSDW